MGTARKRALPLFHQLMRQATAQNKPAPSVEMARLRLGGRAPATTDDAGRIVSLDGGRGLRVVGVVLYGDPSDLDVWIESGVVRRAPAASVEDFGGVVSADVKAIADDARLFSRLKEGQRVRYENRQGEITEGDLVEKCRYGGLVLRGDGKLMAVGFRKLWSATPVVDAPN